MNRTLSNLANLQNYEINIAYSAQKHTIFGLKKCLFTQKHYLCEPKKF